MSQITPLLAFCLAKKYRVSHSKDWKVILLWWGYRFWFLLLFWILHVPEIGSFMPNSSVFIFLMLHALYRMICKISRKKFAKKSLNVTNVKLLSNFFFNVFGFFYAFLVRMTACALHINWFPSSRTYMASMTSTASTTSVDSMTSTASFHQKTFNLKKNIYFGWLVTIYYLKKALKSQNNSNFIENWWIRHKWA